MYTSKGTPSINRELMEYGQKKAIAEIWLNNHEGRVENEVWTKAIERYQKIVDNIERLKKTIDPQKKLL